MRRQKKVIPPTSGTFPYDGAWYYWSDQRHREPDDRPLGFIRATDSGGWEGVDWDRDNNCEDDSPPRFIRMVGNTVHEDYGTGPSRYFAVHCDEHGNRL